MKLRNILWPAGVGKLAEHARKFAGFPTMQAEPDPLTEDQREFDRDIAYLRDLEDAVMDEARAVVPRMGAAEIALLCRVTDTPLDDRFGAAPVHLGGRCMIRNTVMPLAWLMLASVIIGAAIAFASPAHADPVSNYAEISAGPICSTLDSYPSLAGVSGVAAAIEEDAGFSAYDAGRVIAMAVIDYCPRHLGLLRQYVAVYAPQSRTVV